MRDPRFIARHRGGLLDISLHRLLAAWAADCAEHVLPLFQSEADDRPLLAIEVARAWSRGQVSVGIAQKASVSAHAAARAAATSCATAVARAAGHAVATAHMADHALGGALYALKAIDANQGSVEDERTWQISCLPHEVRDLVLWAFNSDRFNNTLLADKNGSINDIAAIRHESNS